MKPSITASLLFATLAASCASTAESTTATKAPVDPAPAATPPAGEGPSAGSAEVETPAEPELGEAQATEASFTPESVPPSEEAPEPARRPLMSDGELELWRDPAFKRYFTQSYIAETEIEPAVPLEDRETLLEVYELMESDDLAAARELLLEENVSAQSPVFDFTLANIYFQTDELDAAGAACERAVASYPKYRRAWKTLAFVRVRQQDYPAAAAAFTKVLELGGGDAYTYGSLGIAYTQAQEFLGAETAFRMALLLDPESPDWKMGLANSFFQQRRYPEAVALCENLIADDPGRPELWEMQAKAFLYMGKPLEAAENFELAVEMGKASATSLNLLGDIYINEGLYDVAVERYDRAFVLDPAKGAERAIQAAQVLGSRGANDEAGRLIQHVEELAGEELGEEQRKDLLKLRARLAVAAGQGDEEVAILEEIVAIDPLDGDALLLLGQHAERMGDVEQAIFYYERVQSLEDFEAAGALRHAQLLVRQGDYKGALPLLRRSQSLEPREHVQEFLEQVEQRVPKGR